MQPATDRDTTAWYLIHTKPRQEHIALTNLERQGYTCYLPLLRVEKIRRRKAEVVSEPMFARYLFVRLSTSDNAPSWAPIRSTLGDTVVITEGPFAGLEAAYQMSDAEQRAMVLMHLLSHPVPVQIHAASLRKVN